MTFSLDDIRAAIRHIGGRLAGAADPPHGLRPVRQALTAAAGPVPPRDAAFGTARILMAGRSPTRAPER